MPRLAQIAWVNHSGDKVRIAQYISTMPADEDNEDVRPWRISSWKERNAPKGYAFPGDPLKREQHREAFILREKTTWA